MSSILSARLAKGCLIAVSCDPVLLPDKQEIMWTEITRVQYRREELAHANDLRAVWQEIVPLLRPCRLGRPGAWSLRVIVEAIF